MGSLESKRQILHLRNNYSKRTLQNYTKALQLGFPHSVKTLCPNFKNHEDKVKGLLLMIVSMPLICPISNGMLPY